MNIKTLQCGDRQLKLDSPQIMGILNITPDSFSDGGQLFTEKLNLDAVAKRAEQMLLDGATILDVGGESTRPGATPISEQQEADRVLPVLELLRKEFDVVVSVDTSTASIMTESAALGAGLINDVRALQREGALQAAASSGIPVCLMHMQGSPETMQHAPTYRNAVEEVLAFLLDRVSACTQAGIQREKLLVDPGFGFGKTPEHNLQLLNRLNEFTQQDLPVLVGLSRKSLIGILLKQEVDQRVSASVQLALIAMMNGANILRVHDVAETAQAVTLFNCVNQETILRLNP